MKFNVSVDIDWVSDEQKLDDEIKDCLVNRIKHDVVESLRDDLLASLNKDEAIKEIKKSFENQLKEIGKVPEIELLKVKSHISECFGDFIKRRAVKVTRYGEVIGETTIENLIGEKLEEYHNNHKSAIDKIISDSLSKARLSDYDIEKLVKQHSEKIAIENASKVAEFLIKGLK